MHWARTAHTLHQHHLEYPVICYLIRVEVQPHTPPFWLASIEYRSHPKTVAILKSYRELLPEATNPKAVPVRYFYGMSDGKIF